MKEKLDLPGGFRVSRVYSRGWKMLGWIGWRTAWWWSTASKLFTWTVLIPGSVLLPNPTSHLIFHFLIGGGGTFFRSSDWSENINNILLKIKSPLKVHLHLEEILQILTDLPFSENSLRSQFCGFHFCVEFCHKLQILPAPCPPRGLSVNILYFVSDPISDNSYKAAAAPAHDGSWQ